MTRGQANMPALLVALLALTAVAGIGTLVADDAFGGATRDADGQRIATGLSERLVRADSPLADRANVLNGSETASLTAAELESLFPVVQNRSVRVSLDDETLAQTGRVDGGTTVRRIVLVERREAVTITPSLGSNSEQSVTLPRRTENVTVELSPPVGTTVRTVRANGRVVLHDDSGLSGTETVSVSRYETTALTFEATDRLPDGSVTVTYYPSQTRKAVLAVTVDG
ncbi:DUF7263 family protein [Halostella pelagica]|uniref:DUF7263 family protein n=1 Tax=Halostella pelagica TaxID=2583824 RepID=UPI00108165B9|nr:hypothetical protein [Halostella pelagica]